MTNDRRPDRLCRRDACAEEPQHRGEEHLDPRSPRFDGPDLAVGALNSGPRAAARALLAACAPVPEVVDLVQEIHRLNRTVAALRVDKDRSVEAASRRALDCADHGHLIKSAEESAHHFDQMADRHEAARRALVGVLYTLKDAVGVLQGKARRGEELPTTAELVETIGGFLDKASKSHDAAWRREEAKARNRKVGAGHGDS